MAEPESYLAKRTVTALYTDAQPTFLTKRAFGFSGRVGGDLVKKAMRGSWVSGTVFLTESHVAFCAHVMGKLALKAESIADIEIPLSEVTDIALRNGVGAKVVDFVYGDQVLTIRGNRLSSFVEDVRANLPK